MTSQPVQIHGVPCVLTKNNGGGTLTYSVTTSTGTVLTHQPSRFLAVARAAEAIRTQRTTQ